MDKLVISSYDEFAAYLGKNLGVSDYVELTQELHKHALPTPLSTISGYTFDTERAARESQFGTTHSARLSHAIYCSLICGTRFIDV